MRTRTLLPLLLLPVVLACSAIPVPSPGAHTEQDRQGTVYSGLDERNRTVKKSDAWLRQAYRSIGIRSLRDIPASDYARYRQYVPRGSVTIIVHPAYFPFFDTWSVTPIETDYTKGLPSKNVVERISDRLRPTDVAYLVAREQERIIRDFVEFLSAEQHLLVLVLPRDYRAHLTYGRIDEYDEYARYINELTNGADNIVYLESAAHDSGYLRDDDLSMLTAFLDAAGAGTILLGGGFLGTCLDNLGASLRKSYSHEDIWYVTDLTTLSPADIVPDRDGFLSFWGGLRREELRGYLETIAFNRTTRERMRWTDLSVSPANGSR
jgi:hypothetical protein